MSAFQLQARQDMAVHRFTQYCNTKGILLIHGVGSGKTTTSLVMALNSFDWGEQQTGRDDRIVARRICVVHPSGIFENFISDLIKNIPNISNKTQLGASDDIDHPDITGYRFAYHGKPFSIYGFKYKYLSEKAGQGDYLTIKKKFKDSIVIFDEAHRLFRPITSKPAYTLIKILQQEQIIKVCKRFIAMTGTPYNAGFEDIFEMLRFIECAEEKRTKLMKEDLPKMNIDELRVVRDSLRGDLPLTYDITSQTRKSIIDNIILEMTTHSTKFEGIFIPRRLENGTCMDMSIFYPRNFVGLVHGSVTITRILDTWIFGGIQAILNIIPDAISVDIVDKFTDRKRYFKLAWEYWVLGNKRKDITSRYGSWQEIENKFLLKFNNGAEEAHHPREGDERRQMGGGSINEILFENLNEGEKSLLFAAVHIALNNASYRDRIKNNQDGFNAYIDKFSDKAIFPSFSNAVGSFFKEYELNDIPQIEAYINNAILSSGSGNDVVLQNISNIPIKEDIAALNGLIVKANTISTKHVGGANCASKGCCDCVGNDDEFKADSFWYRSSLGDRCKHHLQELFNIYNPYDYEKIADKALQYASVWDIDEMNNPLSKFLGRKTADGLLLPGYTSTTLKDIISVDPKKIQDINKTIYTYPQKEISHFYNQYTPDQEKYNLYIAIPKIDRKWWRTGRSSDLNNLRNPVFRSIGNYSKDYERFSADFIVNEDRKYPKYYMIDIENREDEVPIDTLISRKATFMCPKFIRILQHLLLMKSGNMFSQEKVDDSPVGNIIQQPHLVNKDNIIGIDDNGKVNEGIQRLMQAARCDVAYDDELKDYMIDHMPDAWAKVPPNGKLSKQKVTPVNGKIPGIAYDEDIKLNIPYATATHYFLPLVWSCAGIDKYEIGSNIFSAFLDILGLKYIVLHTEATKECMNREKIRAFQKVYHINKSPEFVNFVMNKLFSDTNSNLEHIYRNIKTYIDRNPSIKEQPICVIIHPESTEGLDAKFNPAIILMEPPNTIGDYEQLCGRVMRTYSPKNKYTVKPKKMVYQCICYNGNELNILYDNRFHAGKTTEQLSAEGMDAFFNADKDIKPAIKLAIEQQKESLHKYRYNTLFKIFGADIDNMFPEFSSTLDRARYWTEWVEIKKKWMGAAIKGDYTLKKFYEGIENDWKKDASRPKLTWGNFLLFTGDRKYSIALSTRNSIRAIEFINEKTKMAGRYNTNLVARDANEHLLTRKETNRLETLVRNKGNPSSAIQEAYNRIASSQINSQYSPDISRITKLASEAYIIKQFMNIFTNKFIFPDLYQIEKCAEKTKGADLLQWCNPFIRPTAANERLVCRSISDYSTLTIKERDALLTEQKRKAALDKFNTLQDTNAYEMSSNAELNAKVRKNNITLTDVDRHTANNTWKHMQNAHYAHINDTNKLIKNYIDSYNYTIAYKPGKEFVPLNEAPNAAALGAPNAAALAIGAPNAAALAVGAPNAAALATGAPNAAALATGAPTNSAVGPRNSSVATSARSRTAAVNRQANVAARRQAEAARTAGAAAVRRAATNARTTARRASRSSRNITQRNKLPTIPEVSPANNPSSSRESAPTSSSIKSTSSRKKNKLTKVAVIPAASTKKKWTLFDNNQLNKLKGYVTAANNPVVKAEAAAARANSKVQPGMSYANRARRGGSTKKRRPRKARRTFRKRN